MFLCKHPSTPGGRRINVLGANSHKEQHLRWPHVHPYLCTRSLQITPPLTTFSLFISLQHTYNIYPGTQARSSCCSLSLIPRLLTLSSDFPVVHWHEADQYIITGFEAYIYYRSDAITTVISLLPLA